jgi:hypothetical protein
MSHKKSKRRLAFLAKHPVCCFCGTARAETIDHVPARAMFDGARWPDGYQFPACLQCNNSTSGVDQVVGVVSRMGPLGQESEDQRREVAKQIQKLHEHYPKLALEMKEGLRANAVRKAIREGVLQREPGKLLLEHPLIAVPQGLHALVRLFGAKLALALHYKHALRIAPRHADILVKWYSNVDAMSGKMPVGLFAIEGLGVPTLQRENIVLNDQFDYRFACHPDGNWGVYIATVRGTFVVVGMVAWDLKIQLPFRESALEIRPFGRDSR